MRQGIGTLSEKTVHAVMKNYYAPDTDMHEIPIENFVADIYTGQRSSRSRQGHLIKCGGSLMLFCRFIRSRSSIRSLILSGCSGLTRKPERLLPKRKSPKTGNPYMAFIELYKIRPYLSNPNLHLKLALLDMEEYRL